MQTTQRSKFSLSASAGACSLRSWLTAAVAAAEFSCCSFSLAACRLLLTCTTEQAQDIGLQLTKRPDKQMASSFVFRDSIGKQSEDQTDSISLTLGSLNRAGSPSMKHRQAHPTSRTLEKRLSSTQCTHRVLSVDTTFRKDTLTASGCRFSMALTLHLRSICPADQQLCNWSHQAK